MSVELDSLLTHTPEVRHDRVRIAGTGITVHRVAVLSNLGHSPEEIVRKYKHLSLAGVHAALAYYHANRTEIDRVRQENSYEYWVEHSAHAIA